jgi:hypothetical protein
MGFHRRHLTSEFIIAVYENSGISGVVKLITKPECIMYDSNCKLCSDVVDAISKDNLELVKFILDNKIKNND